MGLDGDVAVEAAIHQHAQAHGSLGAVHDVWSRIEDTVSLAEDSQEIAENITALGVAEGLVYWKTGVRLSPSDLPLAAKKRPGEFVSQGGFQDVTFSNVTEGLTEFFSF